MRAAIKHDGVTPSPLNAPPSHAMPRTADTSEHRAAFADPGCGGGGGRSAMGLACDPRLLRPYTISTDGRGRTVVSSPRLPTPYVARAKSLAFRPHDESLLDHGGYDVLRRWSEAEVKDGTVMGQLYPDRPRWLGDVRAAVARVAPQWGLPPSLLELALRPYLRQRAFDERYAHLSSIYEALAGGSARRRPLLEHAAHFRAAGFELILPSAAARPRSGASSPPSSSPSKLSTARPRTAADLGRVARPKPATSTDATLAEAYALLTAGGCKFVEECGHEYSAPSPPPPRPCERCSMPCRSECRCGEAYCSAECQTAAWPGHRDACTACLRVLAAGVRLTQWSWVEGAQGRWSSG